MTSARQPCPVATNLHWSWLFIKFPTYRFLRRFIVRLKRSNADFSKAHQSLYLDNNFRVQLFLQVVLIFKLYWRGTRFLPLYVRLLNFVLIAVDTYATFKRIWQCAYIKILQNIIIFVRGKKISPASHRNRFHKTFCIYHPKTGTNISWRHVPHYYNIPHMVSWMK